MIDIVQVNLVERKAVLSTGEIIVITNMYDHEGDETSDVDAMVTFVAGPDAEGHWYTDNASNYTFDNTLRIN